MKRRSKAKTVKTKRSPLSRLNPVRNSLTPVVSVVIPVSNERKTIASVIRQAREVHPETEVIVVANGTRDGSDRIAERMGAVVLRYDQPLGHDVGRAIGARRAKGSVILFTDGDIVIPAEELVPFIQAVRLGTDVALNDYSGPVRKDQVHSAVLAKYALNIVLNRHDLKGTSMTAIPHALSRRALSAIGCDKLAVPPLAHAAAVQTGLRVAAVHEVPVGKRNPLKKRKAGLLENLIFGDHLEALHWLLQQTNARANLTDFTRNREYAG